MCRWISFDIHMFFLNLVGVAAGIHPCAPQTEGGRDPRLESGETIRIIGDFRNWGLPKTDLVGGLEHEFFDFP